ncbi:lamin tail domain-containing protein [Adhaeribacter soli]|uniref:LTD domain-containing protein n=1 Tax=Adhaeribacter soli TaxID=2607655 RepID=A0A5N1IV64_9BACT|nr:lamin tail domain-containing protein [Adhaeribacter soli]KAA9333638.1 hypothetical protein F0P94_10330 [Adhaeribacter soli]
MQRLLLFLFLIISIRAQAQLQDNFSDGNFTANPVWNGDVSLFTVNATQQLQSNGPAATATGQLVTPSQVNTGAEWEFYANLKFATSSANYTDVYLMSDQATLTGTNTGYFVRIGDTPDEVSLYRKDAAASVKIIDGVDATMNSSTNNVVRIKVTRSVQNLWSLSIDVTGAGTTYVSQGTATDATYQRSEYFGVYIKYSSTNSTKFYFDDFKITDITAPVLNTISVISATQLDVLFNEPVSQASAQNTANFIVSGGGGSPATAVQDATNPALVHLTFAANLPSGTSTLTATGITDLYGNMASTLNGQFNVTTTPPPTSTANFRDVRITEIMADFSPVVGLPAAEYIEIYNNSNKTLNLANWKYNDASTSVGTFPAYTFLPGTYVILCAKADTTALKVFGRTLGLSTFPSLNDAGDDVKILDNTGKLIDKVSYTSAWYNDPTKSGGGWSLELKNPNNPCQVSANWTASTDPSGGTPDRQNSVFSNAPDTTPPTLLSVETVSNTSIKLSFSESMDSLSLLNATYGLNNGIGITAKSVAKGIFHEITLTLSPALVRGATYTLTASNATDCAGNIMAPATLTFSTGANFHDVRITEIMADFNPPVGLPEAEYLEIYNNSNKIINLANWKYFDATTSSGTLPAYNLAPGAYVILCAKADTAAFRPFGKVLGLSSFPSLNDAGDEVRLYDNSGVLIDKVTYSSSWYNDPAKAGGGWSLELVNPNLPCQSAVNWIASNNPQGGTPGRQNSGFSTAPDTQAPRLVGVETISNTQLKLTFSETMDSLSLTTAGYTINKGISVSAVAVTPGNFQEVTLTLTPALTAGASYEVTVTNATDCSGNVIQAAAVAFGLGSKPGFNQLIITEIMADESPVVEAAGGILPGYEYLEIYNPTNLVLDLKGVKLSDGGTPAVFPALILGPGEYAILNTTSRVNAFSFFGRSIGLSNFPSLNNAGETLTLRGADGKLIHSVTYSDTWYKDTKKKDGGWSLEMIDISNPCTGFDNWTASNSPNGGTPGKVNSVNGSRPDNMAPQLLKAQAGSPTTIVLNFNEKLDSLAAMQATYRIPNGPAISQIVPLTPTFTTVELTLAQALEANQQYSLEVSNVRDCAGNLAGLQKVPFALPVPAKDGDLVINEVLFNPKTGGVDFVEIANRSNNYIDLKNWQLANFSNDSVSNKKLITAATYVLAPQQLVVLTTRPDIVMQHYPKHNPDAFLAMASFPSYSDDAGTVILVNAAGKIADRFDYTDDMHFVLLDDDDGVSLERIRLDGPTIAANFHSAASTSGFATPGLRNSQVQGNVEATSVLTIEPKVFSPDGDGYKDFTTLNFNASRIGQVASVTILDSRGREIKKLVNNQTLSGENFFHWDGTTNEGRKAPVGYYLVLVDLYDLSGKQQTFKETVVVGAKF